MVVIKQPSSPSQKPLIILHALTILLLISYASVVISGVRASGRKLPTDRITKLIPLPPTPLPSPLINVTHGCLDSERSALLQFKAGLNDPHGRLSSWRGVDCCRWRGVACHSTTGAIVKVVIHSMQVGWDLSGRIDPSLLHLKSLRHLDLSGNTFHGITIPAFIGSFEELRYLDLSYAGFTGSIPHQLGNLTRLQYLDLSYNYLVKAGLISSSLRADGLQWVSGLSSLRHLAMDNVNLSSAMGSADWVQLLNERLPSLVELHLSSCGLRSINAASLHFVNFSSLEVINIGYNDISSTLPSWLSNISSLVLVDMRENHLHGPIPKDFSQLPNLEYLDLSSSFGNLSADVTELLGHGGWPQINTLVMSHNMLHGVIPASIGNYTSLVKLDLRGNNIGGGIPASFGLLCELTLLDLAWNNLTGHLPEFLFEPHDNKCSSRGYWPSPLPGLVTLYLSGNSLVGNLPAWQFECASLQFLDAFANKFTGVLIEAHLSKLRNLQYLELGGNLLTSNISSDWVPPFQLSYLSLASCQLGPKFPSWIKTQRKLEWLDLSKTGISDKIPSWFWELSSKINGFLNISFNHISGQVPRTWCPSPHAYALDMSSNLLRGHLPLKLASRLRQLDLSANCFYGPIWPNIGEMMPNMISLFLFGNYLSGEIPATIGEMYYLQDLDLSKNNLTGGIPMALLNCSFLTFLNLGNNNLTGAIPTSPTGRLKDLEVLLLNDNLLSREIPLSICDCSALKILDVSGNMLHGNIPTWMGNLQTLRILRLRSNRFSGEIPWQLSNLRLLQVLDVAENNLTGLIPEKLGSLRTMMHAEKLYYSPMTTIGGYFYNISLYIHVKGLDLEYYMKTEFLVIIIDLSRNRLSGEFPKSLVNLSSLIFMDLSRNLLNGIIPDAIGRMQQLQSLDLSSNHFSGKIPSSLADLNFLSFLNLSNNNFSGRIPVGRQLDTFSNESFFGNPYLCGPLFPSSHCPEDNVDSVGINKHVEIHAGNDLYMGLGFGFAFGLLAPLIILLIVKRWRAIYFQVVDHIVDKLL